MLDPNKVRRCWKALSPFSTLPWVTCSSSNRLNLLLICLVTGFAMAEDPFSAMGDKITSKHRTATIGRYQADKRRARGNLPTWSEVSAMYADEPLVEEELSPKSETNKRWTVSLASSSLLDFSDHSCTYCIYLSRLPSFSRFNAYPPTSLGANKSFSNLSPKFSWFLALNTCFHRFQWTH